jgi:hypothetical protein
LHGRASRTHLGGAQSSGDRGFGRRTDRGHTATTRCCASQTIARRNVHRPADQTSTVTNRTRGSAETHQLAGRVAKPGQTLSGHRTANTAFFDLERGGNYVHRTATTRASSCFHAIYVRAPDRPDLRNLLANTLVQGVGTTLDGDSHVYNVRGGR